MTQAERRLFLIQALKDEQAEYRDLRVPRDAMGQRKLLRSLLNVRAPGAVGDDFLAVQDDYLQQELAEDGVTRAGDWLQKKFRKMGPITDGFVSGSLVFAVGAMAVMGSLDSGLKNDHGILLAKSVIDFAGSVAFASSMGIGIVFSGLSVLAVEGVMTLLASLLTGVLTDAVITEISVTGSLMIIGITLNVLGVTKLRILNMTPALLLPVLLCKFM